MPSSALLEAAHGYAIRTFGTVSLTRCSYRHGVPDDSRDAYSAVWTCDMLIKRWVLPILVRQSSPPCLMPAPVRPLLLACRQLVAEAINARKLTVECRPSDGQNQLEEGRTERQWRHEQVGGALAGGSGRYRAASTRWIGQCT
jgi:hypothetical protein